MAEPLSLTASIIAIVQISESLLLSCYRYVGTVGRAKKDILRIINVVSSLKGVLDHVEALVKADRNGQETPLQLLNTVDIVNGPLASCTLALRELAKKLELAHGTTGNVRNAIMWPWKEKEVRKLLQTIENQKTTIIIALAGDNLRLSLNINNNIGELGNSLRTMSMVRDCDKVINWLKLCDPSTNHIAARAKQEPGTGNWFIDSNAFDQWMRHENKSVWLHGIPGAGKSILTSTIIEKIKMIGDTQSEHEYAYFYFDFNDREKQTVNSFLRSIIVQLSIHKQSLPSVVKDLYKICDNGEQQPRNTDLIMTLRSLSANSFRIYLVVDALDECSERREALEVIKQFIGTDFKQVNILMTSRMEHDIWEALQDMVSESICIQSQSVDADIELYARNFLANDSRLRRWSPSVREEILESIIRGAHGMFRWAVCQLESLRNCLKLSALRLALRQLPKTLDETYDRILESIPEAYRKEAQAVLQLLAVSARRLSLIEVAEAVAVNLENQCFHEEDRLQEPEDVLEICSSLIALSDNRIEDETGTLIFIDEEKTLGFAHYSVKEYLTSKRITSLPQRSSFFGFSEIDAHWFTAEICITYLLSLAENSEFRGFSFIEYAAQYWHVHAVMAEKGNKIQDSIRRLFGIEPGYRFVENWLNIWNPDGRILPNKTSSSARFPQPLYFSSLLGLYDATKWLLESGMDVNIVGGEYGTALQAAVLGGSERVVRLILQCGADVNIRGGYFGSALQAAAWSGRLEMVQLLLEHGADVNGSGGEYGNALIAAAGGPDTPWSQKRDAVVQMLLHSGMDINANDSYYGNALQVAARTRAESVVRVLLNAGASINAKGGIYTDCLVAASRGGSAQVVKWFLELGAATTANALQAAAWGGHEKIVQLLLESGADVYIDSPGGDYGTALEAADSQGHTTVMNMIKNWKMGESATVVTATSSQN